MALIGALRALGRSRAVGPAAAMPLSLLRHMTTVNNKLFIGGLAWETDEGTLRDAFSSFGEVSEAKIIYDRNTGRSRGFGFVSFSSGDDAQTAVAGMDGKSLGGRTIRVDYATERQPGAPRPGFNRQGGGFNRQGSGYNRQGGYEQQGQGGGYGDQAGYGQQAQSQAPQEAAPQEAEASSAETSTPATPFAAGGSV